VKVEAQSDGRQRQAMAGAAGGRALTKKCPSQLPGPPSATPRISSPAWPPGQAAGNFNTPFSYPP